MLALELKDVAMHFAVAKNHEGGEHKVFAGLSLQINQGEKVGLVGRNGVGKSTLLRIIAGIYPPHAGSIWRNPNLSIALLSLGLGFKNDLTGRENAYLAAMLQGLGRRVAKARLDEIGDFTELGDYYDEPVKSYSSGMRARLGFATGLLLDTDILLLDEILAVGDQVFRAKASKALKEKVSSDRTIIMVHHAQPAIRETCSRVVWLHDGHVRMDGDVNDVLSAYAADSQRESGKY